MSTTVSVNRRATVALNGSATPSDIRNSAERQPIPNAEVALVMNAGTTAGHRVAVDLLRAGYRVAVTGSLAGPLARIMCGQSSARLVAIVADASDPAHVARLDERVEARFGRRVDVVVDAAHSPPAVGSMPGCDAGGRRVKG